MPTRLAELPRHVDPARARRRALRRFVPPVAGIGLALAMATAGSESLSAPAPASPGSELDITASQLTGPGLAAGLAPGSLLDLRFTIRNRYPFPVRIERIALSPRASHACRTTLALEPAAAIHVQLPAGRTTDVRLARAVRVGGPGCPAPPDEPGLTITVGAGDP